MSLNRILCRLGFHDLRIYKEKCYTVKCTRCPFRICGLDHAQALKMSGKIEEPTHKQIIGENSIDVGCGFSWGVQVPVYATVSLDLNMGLADKTFVRNLRLNQSHPVCGDAQNLPIRNRVMGKIYWRAILEHLPNPDQAILEGKRVLVHEGSAEVVLPMMTSHMKYSLISLFTQFPISIIPIAKQLWKVSGYLHLRGMPHLRDVKPEYMKKYFRKVEIIAYPKTHKWFKGPWAKYARRLTNNRDLPDTQGQYLVRCRN